MNPAVDADEVPPFWYCPRCVDRELSDVSLQSPTTVLSNSLLDASQLEPFVSSVRATHNQTSGVENDLSDAASSAQQSISITKHSVPLPEKQDLTTEAAPPASLTNLLQARIPAKHPRPDSSPAPRKKSKYSNFSSDVDKALMTIQKELEKAATLDKSSSSLQSRIQDLEQQLKLKDGQIQLAMREMELARGYAGENDVLQKELEEERKRCRVWRREAEGTSEQLSDLEGRIRQAGYEF